MASRGSLTSTANSRPRSLPGTFRAHGATICPELMRTTEISTPGQGVSASRSPWSGRRLHKTRPTGRLTRLQVSDRPRGAGRQRSCRGRRVSSCESVPGSGCAGRRRGVILQAARRIPSGLVEGSGVSGEAGRGRRLGAPGRNRQVHVPAAEVWRLPGPHSRAAATTTRNPR